MLSATLQVHPARSSSQKLWPTASCPGFIIDYMKYNEFQFTFLTAGLLLFTLVDLNMIVLLQYHSQAVMYTMPKRVPLN